MKKILSLLVLPFLMVGCIKINTLPDANGSGNLVTESREVSGYDRVEISGFGKAEIIQGDHEGVEVTAEDNLLPFIKTEVRNGKLSIGMKSGVINLQPTRSISYKVYVKELKELDLSGAVVTTGSALSGDSLGLNLSGAGSLTLDSIEVKKLDVNLSGAVGVKITGSAHEQNLDISGAGSYEAGDLASDLVTINLSGASSVTVDVAEDLKIDASGTGLINYSGNPIVKQNVSGMVVVKSLDE